MGIFQEIYGTIVKDYKDITSSDFLTRTPDPQFRHGLKTVGGLILFTTLGVKLSGCLGKSEGAGAYAGKQGPYSYTPQPVNPNPDMSDPYKVVEEAVDAIKANDYKAFERLLSPEFKAQIGGDENLKQLVQKQHDKMFEKRAGNDVRINNFADEPNNFFINTGGNSNEIALAYDGVYRIMEW